jgi:predicted RNA-binding protein with TRAM domain
MSGVDVSKLTAFGVTGSGAGVTVSKVVGFVILTPGTEEGGTVPTQFFYTYGQRIKKQR